MRFYADKIRAVLGNWPVCKAAVFCDAFQDEMRFLKFSQWSDHTDVIRLLYVDMSWIAADSRVLQPRSTRHGTVPIGLEVAFYNIQWPSFSVWAIASPRRGRSLNELILICADPVLGLISGQHRSRDQVLLLFRDMFSNLLLAKDHNASSIIVPASLQGVGRLSVEQSAHQHPSLALTEHSWWSSLERKRIKINVWGVI